MSKHEEKPLGVSQGIYWNSLATLLGDGQKFIVQLVLARLLVPEDFGKVGMVMVFTTIIFSISELGLCAALIQRKNDLLKSIHFDTVFWMSFGFGIALFAFLGIVIAPLIAWFYSEPILSNLAILVSATVIIAPLTIVHRAKLTRQMNFRAIATSQGISSFFAGAFCITMAYHGCGLWSMALMGPLTALINVPCMWYMSKWMPKFRFSRNAFRDVFGYGAFVALERGTMAIAQNLDFLLIGRLLGAQHLGVYSLAFMLTDTLRSKIGGAIGSVLFPVYSKVQSDPGSLKRYYLLTVRFSALVLFPILMVLLVASNEIILLGFGEKWAGAIFPLQMLALAGIIHTIGGTSSIVLRAMGKSKLEFCLYFWKTLLITAPAIFIGVHLGGIDGAAISIVIHKLAMRYIQQHYIKKYINVTEMEILRCVLPSLVACAIMSAVILLLIYTLNSSILWLILSLIGGIFSYCVVMSFTAPAEVQRIRNSVGI